MKRHKMNPYAVLLVGTLGAGAVHADEILVPQDYLTIQAAIDVAQNGDEIVLADGTYTGVGNKNLFFPGSLILTIRPASGNRDACVIDCEGDGRFAALGTGDTITVQQGGIPGQSGSLQGCGGPE